MPTCLSDDYAWLGGSAHRSFYRKSFEAWVFQGWWQLELAIQNCAQKKSRAFPWGERCLRRSRVKSCVIRKFSHELTSQHRTSLQLSPLEFSSNSSLSTAYTTLLWSPTGQIPQEKAIGIKRMRKWVSTCLTWKSNVQSFYYRSFIRCPFSEEKSS